MRPLEATLKRFLAPLLVFILGMTAPFSDIAPGASQWEGFWNPDNYLWLQLLLSSYCRRRLRRCGSRLGCFFLYGRARRLCRFFLWHRHRDFFRRQNHHHLAAFHFRKLLDDAVLLKIVFDALNEPDAELLVRHLATAKTQGHFAFVPFIEEPRQVAQLDLVVALVR